MEKFTPPTEEERQARRKLIHERMEAALKLRKEGKSPDYISVFPVQKKVLVQISQHRATLQKAKGASDPSRGLRHYLRGTPARNWCSRQSASVAAMSRRSTRSASAFR